ncbi:MAG: hypothetical protein ACI4TB_10325 [Lachnospiraceae bacterium]
MIAAYTDIRDFEKYLIPVATEKGEEREYDMCKALRDLQTGGTVTFNEGFCVSAETVSGVLH